MKKIKKNDIVIVITGKDKGRSGKVIKIVCNNRVLVEGINLVKKNVKPNPQKNIQGGIVERESSIHISNIALLNPITNKADKVGFKIQPMESGRLDGNTRRKVRYFKSNNELVDVSSVN